MNKTSCLCALSCFVCAAVSSCSYSPNEYSCFSELDPRKGWAYGESYVYVPEIKDSMAQGQLQLLVRHTDDYPFANLWVEVKSLQPSDSVLEEVTDTFCVNLADIYGNWFGRRTGATVEKTDTLRRDFTLVNRQPLKLRHIMRPDVLEGVEKIGFMFKEKNDFNAN